MNDKRHSCPEGNSESFEALCQEPGQHSQSEHCCFQKLFAFLHFTPPSVAIHTLLLFLAALLQACSSFCPGLWHSLWAWPPVGPLLMVDAPSYGAVAVPGGCFKPPLLNSVTVTEDADFYPSLELIWWRWHSGSRLGQTGTSMIPIPVAF